MNPSLLIHLPSKPFVVAVGTSCEDAIEHGGRQVLDHVLAQADRLKQRVGNLVFLELLSFHIVCLVNGYD